jgi:hypothetical protein
MGCISTRKRGSQTYCVYRESRRVKIDRKAQGKKRRSGKSLVRTKAVHLGSAEKICRLIQDSKPLQSVNIRPLGSVAAACQTA